MTRFVSIASTSRSLNSLTAHPARLVFIVCLLLRLLYLYVVWNSGTAVPPEGDPRYYFDWATRIRAGVLSDGQAFFGLPFYAYWLALLRLMFASDSFVPLLIQCVADAATAGVISELTFSILSNVDRRVKIETTVLQGHISSEAAAAFSILAGLGWALFEPAQAYCLSLMPTTLAVLAFWLIVRWVVSLEKVPRILTSGLVGLALGVLSTLVANLLILVPLIFARFFAFRKISSPRPWISLAGAAAILMTGVVMGASPCWIHNYYIAREPVVYSAHGGVNFYLGNQPAATGYPRIPPGMAASQSGLRESAQEIPERALGRKLSRTEAGQYWNDLAKQSIRDAPLHWLGILAVKIRNYWNVFQYDDISAITPMGEAGFIAPGFHFGLVAALGMPGLLIGCALSGRARWIAAAVVLQMISLLPVFVTERYRLPGVPGLLIGAGVGLYCAWHWVACQQWRQLAWAYLAPLAVAVWIVTLPTRDPTLWALDLYNSARVALAQGRTESAGAKVQLAYAYAPRNPEVNFLFGNYWLERAEAAKARTFFLTTVALMPEHARAWNNIAVADLAEAKWRNAQIALEHAARLTPASAKSHYLQARAAQGLNDWDLASSEIRSARLLEPNQAELKSLEAQILAREPALPLPLSRSTDHSSPAPPR